MVKNEEVRRRVNDKKYNCLQSKRKLDRTHIKEKSLTARHVRKDTMDGVPGEEECSC